MQQEIAHDGYQRPAIPPRTVIIVSHLLVAAVVRLLCILRYRIDSDEPQHLHAAWEWSRGLVMYRDFYDNHLPFFHLLFAPFIGLAGETESILLFGRLAMLPLAAAAILLVFLIAERLYGRELAAWSALAASLLPPFLLKSVEFRNDNLWVVLILAAVAVALAEPTRGRTFLLGVLLGLAAVTSIKTVHAVVGIGGALVLLRFSRGRGDDRTDGTNDASLGRWGWLAGGFAIAPLLTVAAFARMGALHELVLFAVKVNGLMTVAPWRRVAGIVLFAAAFVAARHCVRRLQPRRAFVAAAALLFAGSVFAVSPLISARDFLPILPLGVIFAMAALRPRAGAFMHAVPAVLILFTIVEGKLLAPPPAAPRSVIADTLRLTNGDASILDLKGETIFRRRATFVAFEPVGREMVRRGVLPNSVADDLVSRRCYVATKDSSFFPSPARELLSEHYVPVTDELRVAGGRVAADRRFRILVPGDYVPLDAAGQRLGRIRRLEAGEHRLSPNEAAATVVLWAGVGQREMMLRAAAPPARAVELAELRRAAR
ncbi:MAG TPA: glycosyltransferase family 39 protein [Thermoanaerobaculia bacterium]|jgi:hypothetical protein